MAMFDYQMIDIVDGDRDKAAKVAEQLVRRFWDLSELTQLQAPSLSDGLIKATELNDAPLLARWRQMQQLSNTQNVKGSRGQKTTTRG